MGTAPAPCARLIRTSSLEETHPQPFTTLRRLSWAHPTTRATQHPGKTGPLLWPGTGRAWSTRDRPLQRPDERMPACPARIRAASMRSGADARPGKSPRRRTAPHPPFRASRVRSHPAPAEDTAEAEPRDRSLHPRRSATLFLQSSIGDRTSAPTFPGRTATPRAPRHPSAGSPVTSRGGKHLLLYAGPSRPMSRQAPSVIASRVDRRRASRIRCCGVRKTR